MRGSVGSNINRRKLTAKYKKTPDTTAVKGTASTPTTNRSSTPQTSESKGKRTTLSRRTPAPERVRERKIVPVTGEIATQGITSGPVLKETRKATEARDLQDKVISSEIDEDGNRTGRWDANKDMKEMWHVEKFIRGIISPYEQPVQMVKNIVEELPPEKQIVKDTGLDLVIDPVMETFTGAKDMGLTNKDFYWPDQLTGIDHPSAPAFLRTGGGSGSDILGGLANNFGYIADVVTHKDTGNVISQKYEGSAARFIEQPAYYAGSAIGEIPLWFIGVGQAKAAVTISSKLAVTAVKMTAATGKLPGPATIKAIVQTERAATAVDKNVIKANKLLVDGDQGRIINSKLPKNLDRAVNAALNVIKKDLDLPIQQDIKTLAVAKDANKVKQKLIGQEIGQLRKDLVKTPGPQDKSNLKIKIASKRKDLKTLESQWKTTNDKIKVKSSELNVGVLRKQFKEFKHQNKSKDNNIARSSKAQYIEWIETKIQPEITRKYKELPNQVDVIQKTKIAQLENSISNIKTSANKIAGRENINQSFWDETSVHKNHLSDNVTSKQRIKLIKLRDRKLKIELEMQRINSNENWAPFGNTIRTLENIPGKAKSSWANTWKTEARLDGDNDMFGVTTDGKVVKMGDPLEKVDGKTPLQPEKRSYGGQSGRLWGMFDYHRDNISKLRSRQVTAIAAKLQDNFLDVGWITKKDFVSAQKQIDETVKPKIEKELSALIEGRTVYQTQKADLETVLGKAKDYEPVDEFGAGGGTAEHLQTFSKYTTKSRKSSTENINLNLDDGIQRRVDDLDKLISAKNTEIGVQEKLLEQADSYVGSNLSGVVPGQGKAKGKYYFEPSFLQQYMGDEYQKIMPQEVLYPKRPIIKATRFGNQINVELGSLYSSPSGMVEGMVSIKAPVIPKGRIKKTVKRFVPHNKVRNRGMTLDNTEFIFTKQADNPAATDIIRVPVNAPDDLKDMLVRAYYQKVSNPDKPDVKFLQGLTGGETSELWKARSIPDKNKDPNVWDDQNINVGQSSTFAAKDSQLDKSNLMLRSYNEIMDTRNVLSGDHNIILEQRIKTLTENQEASIKSLTSLNEKRGLDDVALTSKEKKKMAFLEKQIAEDAPELRKLQKRSDNKSDENEFFARYGVGFGQRRGLVGKFDLGETKNIEPINQSPVIYNKKTEKFYYIAEVANQRKIYELDDPNIADRIRTNDAEVATTFPDTSFGATEYGVVSETSKVKAPGALKASIKTSTYDKDKQIPFSGPITGRAATKETTSKFKDDNNIILAPDVFLQKSKGIRELTNAEVSEFEKGATFSKLVGDIRDDLRGMDTSPDNVSGTQTKVPSKSIKKQMTDFIKINARTKTLSALESGSERVKNVKESIIGNDDWVRMQKTKLRIDDDMYESFVTGGGVRTGGDELSRSQKALGSSKELLVRKSDIPGVEDQVSQLRWMPIDEIESKKPITGLDIFNVIDLGITGGRKRGEIESGWVRDSVTKREYDVYLKAEGEKDAYEELLFASKLNGNERVFRTNLVIAYEKMRGKKYYDTPDSTVRTEASKKSTAEIDQKVDEIIQYKDDKVTKLPTFTPNAKYEDMITDIKQNNLLREVTLKDRAKVVGRRGAKPGPKTVEQRAGLISIKYNFGDLSKSLPSHSLVGRITNRAVSKLQATDNFFSGGMLTGFREKLKYKLNKKTSIGEFESYEKRAGFHQAIEFMQRNNHPVDREQKAKYNATKGMVDSRDRPIEITREERFKSYVEDKGGVSMWVEGNLSDSSKMRIQKLDGRMDSIDRYLDMKNAGNDQLLTKKENFEAYQRAKTFLDPEFKGPVPDEIGRMWDDIDEFEVKYSKEGSDETKFISLSDPRITADQRAKRLEQASIELALEKGRLEKKYIDSGEYSSYSVKIRELQQEKSNLEGWAPEFTVNTRPNETRFRTGFGDKKGVNMFTSKQSDRDSYIRSLDFNIRYLKEHQGKPKHTTAMGKTSITEKNADNFYTIKDSSDNIVAQSSNLEGTDLPQSVLKSMQKKGVFQRVISKDDVKWDDDATRTKAWNDMINSGTDTKNNNAMKLLLRNGYDVDLPGLSSEVTSVTKGKNTTYHYTLPNISGKSDTKWSALQQRERIAEYHEQGFDVNKVLPAQEFKANRQQIPDERGTLVNSRFHEDTLDAINTWQAADIASKRNPKPLTKRYIKWRDSQKKDLGMRVKPAIIKFDEDGNVINDTFDLLEKDNFPADTFGVNREKFLMGDISSSGVKYDKTILIEEHKQGWLREMGVDTKALTPMSDILKKMKEKKQSLNTISSAEKIIFNTKSAPAAKKQARNTVKLEKASISAVDRDLAELQKSYTTQKPQTTIQQKRQMPASAEVKVKFWSFAPSDLTPDYRGKSKSSTTSVNPLAPAFSGVLSTVNVLPKTVEATKQNIDVKTNEAFADDGKSQQLINTKSVTDITSGLDLSLPSLMAGLKINNKLQPAQTNRLDANLGWLSAQLPGQITRPITDVGTVTTIDSAMKLGTSLKTSSLLKLTQGFKLRTSIETPIFKKYQDVNYQSITQRPARRQAILPVVLGALPWELAEERARKRKKKPKRKSAKTWWQTPDNWYESNYWGKDGKGSGYMTFKGSEPKRLKDKKNEFGF